MSGTVITALAVAQLATSCAPTVHPETMVALVQAESGRSPYAIGVNAPGAHSLSPTSRDEAVSLASRLIAAGRNVDLGLAQLNARYNAARGITLADAFEPCANLAAAGRVLTTCYTRQPASLDPQAKLARALSCYNTGDDTAGVRNGYVVRVQSSAGIVVPAIRLAGDAVAAPSTTQNSFPAAQEPRQASCAPSWDPWALVDCERRRAATARQDAAEHSDLSDRGAGSRGRQPPRSDGK